MTENSMMPVYGFGDNGLVWILILFFFFAMGGNGWGGNNLGAEMQRGFDQQATATQLNGINNALNNGFNQLALAGVNGFNSVNSGISDLKFTVAQENCADRQAMNEGFRDLMAQNTANTTMLANSINNGIQQIKDDLCAQRLAQKDAEIAALQNQLNMANLAASQTAQTAYLIEKLTPTTTTAGA